MIRSGTDACRYDNRGRLIRFGTTVLEYDNYGNRTKKNEYEVYTWERGNKLKRITKYPHTEIEYTYDYTGKRSTKSISVGGVQEEYIQYHYDGNNLVGEDRTGGKKLRYFYDAQGICGFRYINGNTIKDIIYVKNIFGDVEFLLDSSGNVLAQYTYDAWGKCSLVSDTDGIGELNPIRYRGYYYDTESKLYYLLTRYYDPEIGMFISPDSVKYLEPWELSGIDLYAYCYHNPIMYYDPTGHFAVTLTVIGLIIGAIIGATIGGMIAYNIASSNGATGWELAGWTILGVLTGAVIGGAIGAGLGALGGAIFPGINAALANGISFSVPALMNLGGVLGFGMAEVAVSGAVVSGVAVSGAVATGILGSMYLFSKRDPSTNKPSWVNKDMYDPSLTPQQNATNMLNEKYGPGNWKTGPGSEFSKIVKWIFRHLLRNY